MVMGRPTEMSLDEAAERYYNTIILPKSNPRVTSREKYMLDKMTSALGKDLPIKFWTRPLCAGEIGLRTLRGIFTFIYTAFFL